MIQTVTLPDSMPTIKASELPRQVRAVLDDARRGVTTAVMHYGDPIAIVGPLDLLEHDTKLTPAEQSAIDADAGQIIRSDDGSLGADVATIFKLALAATSLGRQLLIVDPDERPLALFTPAMFDTAPEGVFEHMLEVSPDLLPTPAIVEQLLQPA